MKGKKLLPIILIAAAVAVGIFVYFFFLRGDPPIVYTNYSPGDYFVTNVKDSNRLFKTAVVLVLDTDKMQNDLDTNKPLIRDTIIFILRELDEGTINNLATQDALRARIVAQLNKNLETEHIVGVLFNDYVVQ